MKFEHPKFLEGKHTYICMHTQTYKENKENRNNIAND